MGQYELALEDADASINKDKTFFEVTSSFHGALFLNLHVGCKYQNHETLQRLCILMFCRACTRKQRFYTWWENSSLHWYFIIEDKSFVLTHRCSGWASRKQRRLSKTLLAVSNSTSLFSLTFFYYYYCFTSWVKDSFSCFLALKSLLLLDLGPGGVKTEIKVDLSLLPQDEVSICDVCPVWIIFLAS